MSKNFGEGLTQSLIDFDTPPLTNPHLWAKKVLKTFWGHLHHMVHPGPKFPFPLPTMVFNLRGECAGQALYDTWVIRINQEMLDKYPGIPTQDVIYHEACHLFARKLFGPRIRPHGPEWKKVMTMANVVPTVTHTYKLTPARKRIKYIVTCSSCFKEFQTKSRERYDRIRNFMRDSKKGYRHEACRNKERGGLFRIISV